MQYLYGFVQEQTFFRDVLLNSNFIIEQCITLKKYLCNSTILLYICKTPKTDGRLKGWWFVASTDDKFQRLRQCPMFYFYSVTCTGTIVLNANVRWFHCYLRTTPKMVFHARVRFWNNNMWYITSRYRRWYQNCNQLQI